MPRYDVAPWDAADWFLGDHNARVTRVVGAVQQTVMARGPAIAQEEVAKTRPHVPVDRGDYRRGFRGLPTKTGALFVNTAAYASVVEYGRRPGRFPPLDVIEGWVRRKFRVSLAQERRAVRKAVVRGVARVAARADADVRGLAFLVARKIARRGIEGRHVMARIEPRLTAAVDEAVAVALRSRG